MQSLPFELSPFFLLPYEELLEQCRLSSYFRDLCNADVFWRTKYSLDYPNKPPPAAISNWKQLYRETRQNDVCIRILKDTPNADDYNQRVTISNCVDEAISKGNLVLLKRYVAKQLFPFPSYANAWERNTAYYGVDLAIQFRQWTIVKYLLTEVYPFQQTHHTNGEFLDDLIKNSQEDLVRYILQNQIASGSGMTYNAIEQIPQYMSLSFIQEALNLYNSPANKSQRDRYPNRDLYNEVAYGAGRGNRIDVIQSLIEPLPNNRKYMERALSGSIKGNHVDTFKYLTQRYPTLLQDNHSVLSGIIQSGAVRIFQYILPTLLAMKPRYEYMEPPYTYDSLTDAIFETSGLNNTSVDKEIALLNVLIEDGYDNFDHIALASFRTTPLYVDEYQDRLSSSVSLYVGGSLVRPDLIERAYSLEREGEGNWETEWGKEWQEGYATSRTSEPPDGEDKANFKLERVLTEVLRYPPYGTKISPEELSTLNTRRNQIVDMMLSDSDHNIQMQNPIDAVLIQMTDTQDVTAPRRFIQYADAHDQDLDYSKLARTLIDSIGESLHDWKENRLRDDFKAFTTLFRPWVNYLILRRSISETSSQYEPAYGALLNQAYIPPLP